MDIANFEEYGQFPHFSAHREYAFNVVFE